MERTQRLIDLVKSRLQALLVAGTEVIIDGVEDTISGRTLSTRVFRCADQYRAVHIINFIACRHIAFALSDLFATKLLRSLARRTGISISRV